MKWKLPAICCVLFLAQACGGSSGSRSVSRDPIIGSGTIVTEDRTLGSFDSVNLMAHANVHLVEGGPQSVGIETDDNIIGHITTTVSAGVLIIDADATYDSVHGVEITLVATDVRRLDLTGVGLIEATSISSGANVRATLTGVGTISLSGTTDTFNGTHTGVGMIDAENLQTRVSTIMSSGIGDCRVHVTEELNATVTGPGYVYYAGNPPTVNKFGTGTARIIPI